MANNQKPESLGFSAEWFRTRYYIENGRILPIPGAAGEYYNPFDHYDNENDGILEESLHIQFANWNFSSDRNIEEFCNTWGLLGLGLRDPIAPGEVVITPEREYYANSSSDSNKPWHYLAEPIREFIRTASEFKWIVSAGNALKENNKKALEELLNHCPGFALPWSMTIPVERDPSLWMGTMINNHLERIHPKILWVTDKTGFHSTIQWQFYSLLDALYMMLALDYQKGRFIRVCNSTTCDTVFVTDREDKIYCSRECAQRQANRDYRERKRLEKQKGGRN